MTKNTNFASKFNLYRYSLEAEMESASSLLEAIRAGGVSTVGSGSQSSVSYRSASPGRDSVYSDGGSYGSHDLR
jgi:hypothetical protein